jgi:ABC-type lipoprotein release transport system permease subunit
MSRWGIIRRSLRHYWRAHVAVLLATAVSGAVLTGALLVGGSVRQSLNDLVVLRLGQVRTAVIGVDPMPKADLANRLQQRLGTTTVAVLTMPGLITVPGSDRRANQVQICGVGDDFPSLSPYGEAPTPKPGSVVLSRSLADHLVISAGQELVVRLEKLSDMPKDTPLAKAEDGVIPLRLAVSGIVEDREWARFGLQADHTAPLNAFVNRDELATLLGVTGRANVFLSADDPQNIDSELGNLLDVEDADLQLKLLPRGGWEARSPRVFIPTGIADEIARRPRRPTRFLTYLANSITKGDRSTPYSFVTGTDAQWVPGTLGDGDIVINQWLADDLAAKIGDRVSLRYYALGTMRNLVEREAEFTVRRIVPLSGPYDDPTLMPDFPGIAESADCTDWDTGADIDFSRIRPKDEQYWDEHRGTPKAFISLERAQALWGNRFGSLTAVRFREPRQQDVEQALGEAIRAHTLGLQTQPVWEDGLRASSKSVDFGSLFLSLSFFLIAAALLLVALLYSLGLERRQDQILALRATGWTSRGVRSLLQWEGMCVALPGALLGALGGILYNAVVIVALTSIWSGSVGHAPLSPHFSWSAVLIGIPVTLLVAYLALRFPLRRSTAGAPRETIGWAVRRTRPRVRLAIGGIMVALGVGLILVTPAGRGKDASAAFFGAGSLLLVGLLVVDAARRRAPTGTGFDRTTLTQRGACRSPGRSLAVEAILAAAVFLTVAVGANRHGSQYGAEERSSGTGGFAFFGETTVPVFEDLNSPRGRARHGLDEDGLKELRFVPFTLQPGDETSCLNLNRPQRPRLLGVDPEELDSRHAFQFTNTIPEVDKDHPWLSLTEAWDDATVPAIADETVIVWALGRKVGETFTIQTEDGRLVRLRLVAGLANSVLQGSLIVNRKALETLYPAVSGSRIFLIDAPREGREELGNRLRASLRDSGLELTPSAERLARFAAVENTYLAIFLALGGLALLLGGVGLGLVLVRNVIDRRGELALLRAIGFSRNALVHMLFVEHAWLFLRGVLVGAVAGLVAVLPAIATPGSNPAFGELALVLGAVFANGLLWIRIASKRALQTPLVPALRDE